MHPAWQVFFVIGFSEDLEAIADAAWDSGILAPGTVWFGADGFTLTSTILQAANPAQLRDRLVGFSTISPSPIFYGGLPAPRRGLAGSHREIQASTTPLAH